MAKKDTTTATPEAKDAAKAESVATLSRQVNALNARVKKLEEENAGLRTDKDSLTGALREAKAGVADAVRQARNAPAVAAGVHSGGKLVFLKRDHRVGGGMLPRGTTLAVLHAYHGAGIDLIADGLRNGLLGTEVIAGVAPPETAPDGGAGASGSKDGAGGQDGPDGSKTQDPPAA